MALGFLKPLLTSLALPPLSLLLLALLGVLLARRHKRAGLTLVTLSLAALWVLSCHGTAVWLARHALPQFDAVTAAQLKTRQVQAIVVLGGGVLPDAPEYGGVPQPSPFTAARLRYSVWLARASSLPLAFTGGIGWAADGMQPTSEAAVAARMVCRTMVSRCAGANPHRAIPGKMRVCWRPCSSRVACGALPWSPTPGTCRARWPRFDAQASM